MRALIAALLFFLAAHARAVEAFPKKLVFEPLWADPRWPAFSGAMQRYTSRDPNLLWAVTVGESFPLVGGREGEPWQFGLQAAVFTIWDVQSESQDLINADFIAGLPYTWRRGRWTFMARLFHVSSHLGDEFVLSNKSVERLNLSYEALDAKASYDLDRGFRAYAGAGRMIRRFPPDLKPLFGQLGGQWIGETFAYGILRPLAAADFQKHEQNGWSATGISLRGGVQMQNRDQRTRCIQFLLEYYRGHDPNGQFFRDTVEEFGLGFHGYF